MLTVYGGDVDGNVDIASSFGPCAAGGRAWDCVPTFARSNVTVDQWSLCRITKHTKHLFLCHKAFLYIPISLTSAS